MTEPTYQHPAIKCPRCGNTDLRRMRYLEDIIVHREVLGIADDGKTLMIDGEYHTGEGYDDGTGGRLECRGAGDYGDPADCFFEWRPHALTGSAEADLQIDWVS